MALGICQCLQNTVDPAEDFRHAFAAARQIPITDQCLKSGGMPVGNDADIPGMMAFGIAPS
jgi:hypothetical protein